LLSISAIFASTSTPILASSLVVNSFSAKATGHTVPSSRFATSLGFRPWTLVAEWLIFGLPKAESAFHPAEANDRHEIYLMCDNLKTEIEALRAKGVGCSNVVEERWGSITKIGPPGGGEIGLYQPKHPRP
jgi:hypothetical protein